MQVFTACDTSSVHRICSVPILFTGICILLANQVGYVINGQVFDDVVMSVLYPLLHFGNHACIIGVVAPFLCVVPMSLLYESIIVGYLPHDFLDAFVLNKLAPHFVIVSLEFHVVY